MLKGSCQKLEIPTSKHFSASQRGFDPILEKIVLIFQPKIILGLAKGLSLEPVESACVMKFVFCKVLHFLFLYFCSSNK